MRSKTEVNGPIFLLLLFDLAISRDLNFLVLILSVTVVMLSDFVLV
jgi:hypothetical protein